MKTRDLAYVSLFVALNIVIEYTDKLLPLKLPQGGSIAIAILPIFIASYMLGAKKGMLVGFLSAILQLFLGLAYVYSPIQYFLEYVVVLTILGAVSAIKPSLLGISIVQLIRYIIHVLAGVIFFGEYAQGSNVLIYSLTYNLTYMLPSFIVTTLLMLLLFRNKSFHKMMKSN